MMRTIITLIFILLATLSFLSASIPNQNNDNKIDNQVMMVEGQEASYREYNDSNNKYQNNHKLMNLLILSVICILKVFLMVALLFLSIKRYQKDRLPINY